MSVTLGFGHMNRLIPAHSWFFCAACTGIRNRMYPRQHYTMGIGQCGRCDARLQVRLLYLGTVSCRDCLYAVAAVARLNAMTI